MEKARDLDKLRKGRKYIVKLIMKIKLELIMAG